MQYVCIENEKIISILNYRPNVPSSVEVVELSDSNYLQIQNQTHYFDIQSKTIVPVPNEELEQRQVEKENIEPREFLNSTDWMILRHIRQQTLGIPTSLSEQQFIDLENRRNQAASIIINTTTPGV